jgi:hypothetical protein
MRAGRLQGQAQAGQFLRSQATRLPYKRQVRLNFRHCRAALLSPGNANHDSRNVFNINEGVEIFRASKIGNMDDVVGHLRDFASHFFSGSQVQLHSFTRAALKDAGDGRIRLQGSLFLSDQAGASNRQDGYEKK